jgi:ribonucleoside-diphosphate reductase alpha chain
LGAINLTQFVRQPFSEKAKIDWDGLQKTVIVATRFLDNVIAISQYPLKMQRSEAYATRRIGLGITGLADMFVMLGVRYGSEASLKLAEQVMKFMMESTWQASIDLAKERGVFPTFHAQKYLQGNFVKLLPEEMRHEIEHHGIRNSHHNTIAPTGTISLLANNVSNGLEPILGHDYERKIRNAQGDTSTFSVTNYALRIWRKMGNTEKLPPAWVNAEDVSPMQHLHVQAAVQPFIDNAISKTIHLPEHFPLEQLSEVYTEAYKLGLKGCNIFRPNAITGSIISQMEIKDSIDQCYQTA